MQRSIHPTASSSTTAKNVSQSTTRATLSAYVAVQRDKWSARDRALERRCTRWASCAEEDLVEELTQLFAASDVPFVGARVFWKLGPELLYAGCNQAFALDAGVARAADLVGMDDFDPRLAWALQAGKYRSDDRDVMSSGRVRLGIVERQQTGRGVFWLHTAKAPIVCGKQVVGILGMYETIDAARALALSRGA